MIGKLLKNQDGQAMVENAVVLPILLTIFFILGWGSFLVGYLITEMYMSGKKVCCTAT